MNLFTKLTLIGMAFVFIGVFGAWAVEGLTGSTGYAIAWGMGTAVVGFIAGAYKFIQAMEAD